MGEAVANELQRQLSGSPTNETGGISEADVSGVQNQVATALERERDLALAIRRHDYKEVDYKYRIKRLEERERAALWNHWSPGVKWFAAGFFTCAGLSWAANTFGGRGGSKS